MPSALLNAAALKNLEAPLDGVLELWDEMSRGLCLRVFCSGRKAWTFRYRPRDGGGRKRISLGEFPDIGLAEARKRADRLRGAVSGGEDPQAERQAQRKSLTLEALIDRYLQEEAMPKKKPATVALYRSYLKRLIPRDLASKKATNIARADLARLHRTLGAEKAVTANRTIVALSGVYTFGARYGYVPDGYNPARGIEKFRESGRERYLSSEELGRLGEALRLSETEGLRWPRTGEKSKHARKPDNQLTKLSPHVVAAFRLLLFTGCRLREILHLRWSEVDLERGLLLLADSKTGRKPVVLNAPALQVLSQLPRLGDFVILGDHPAAPRADLKRPWDLIRHNAGLGDLRIHDLRHTHASIGAGAGLGLPIIGRLLGHRHQETTARYAHLADDPLRSASNRIGTELAKALEGASLPAPFRIPRPIR